MMNNVNLVGRLIDEPEIEELDGTFRTTINVSVSRDYKNSEGIYETDSIRCTLFNGVARNAIGYCHKGDVVGIKGKLQSRTYETSENEKNYDLEVVVDKMTFISSKNINKSEREER